MSSWLYAQVVTPNRVPRRDPKHLLAANWNQHTPGVTGCDLMIDEPVLTVEYIHRMARYVSASVDDEHARTV